MNILFIEDNRLFAKDICYQLKQVGKVDWAGTYKDAASLIEKNIYDAIFVDLNLDGKDVGIDLIKKINKVKSMSSRHIETFVITNNSDPKVIEASMEIGADHYFTKEKLGKTIDGEIKNILKGLKFKNIKDLFEQEFCTQDVGLVNQVQYALQLSVDRRVKINFRGEAGTGKTKFSKFFHNILDGSEAKYVSVSIVELSEDVLESELFGHKKGSFTGAEKNKTGILESADGGTLFLDEIALIPPALQRKLLKPLGEKRIRPTGGTGWIDLDIRLMTATNENLEYNVETKKFRKDLYDRLNGIQVSIPPLRNRKDDIPLLLERFKSSWKKEIYITPDGMTAFYDYDWPGNVRELQDVVEMAIVGSKGKIDADRVRETIRSLGSNKSNKGQSACFWNSEHEEFIDKHGYKAFMEQMELQIYAYSKIKNSEKVNQMCRHLQVHKPSLYRIKELYQRNEEITGVIQ